MILLTLCTIAWLVLSGAFFRKEIITILDRKNSIDTLSQDQQWIGAVKTDLSQLINPPFVKQEQALDIEDIEDSCKNLPQAADLNDQICPSLSSFEQIQQSMRTLNEKNVPEDSKQQAAQTVNQYKDTHLYEQIQQLSSQSVQETLRKYQSQLQAPVTENHGNDLDDTNEDFNIEQYIN